MTRGARGAYTAAGVDVEAGEQAVELIRSAVESTRRPEMVGGLGGFAGAMTLPVGLRDPLLVSATDGVGTKTAVAAALDRWDTIGIDLVAMCVDDVVCTGAAPLFFLDYVAVGRLDPERIARVVGGIAAGCRQAGCSLVGGETAEHPGLMEPDALDLAGFCVGVVERDEVLDGSAVRAGDAIVGLAASGLHANGYSLVRRTIADAGLSLETGFIAAVQRVLGPDAVADALVDAPDRRSMRLGEVLLAPTRIYASAVLAARAELIGTGSDLHGLAHVTGGGLPGNVPRALPAGLAARLDPARWRVPAEVELISALAGIDEAETRATFNAGIGMVAVVPPGDATMVIRTLAGRGVPAAVVGEVLTEGEAGGRYVEGPLATGGRQEAG